MNVRIVRLFGLISVLFAVLVGFTSWWSVIDADNLRDQQVNKRPLFASQKVQRGRILAADGSVLARSVRRGHGGATHYLREYPEPETWSHPVGYSFVEQGSTELEQFHNRTLIGEGNEFSSLVDRLRGKHQAGNDLYTSLEPAAQAAARDGLAGRPGAVVAIEPATGRVRAMVSQPGFDPNRIPEDLSELSKDSSTPLVNRATQGQYPPGSVFKLVTAAAALDSGAISPETLIESPASITVQGSPLANFGGATYGEIDVTTALTSSVNTFFAKLGRRVGEQTLFDYMERFGFGSKPRIDLPRDQLSTSGVFSQGELIDTGDGVDVARIAIGQERLLATPLQMALVGAAIANDGKLMRPRIWNEIRDADGRTRREMKPQQQSRVISADTAAALTEAMRSVVNEGTGTAAALSGVDVAGKTGTAEVPDKAACGGLPNQAWFVGFAPADEPRIAVAATVECTDGQGGTVAAPIVASVMETLIGS